MRSLTYQVPLLRWVASNRLKSSSSAVSSLRSVAKRELDGIQTAGTWKKERIITSKQDVSIQVEGSGRKLLNFCANNYLGLSSHPEIIKAGVEALDKYGAGLSSVRFICGTQDIHLQLENKIAQFHKQEAAIWYPKHHFDTSEPPY
uniref:Aminotransferase class I/classII large domain-containing protein n=1 Tax=Strigamia maritima TaxID=126957 RepID=T1IMJ0_STRMM